MTSRIAPSARMIAALMATWALAPLSLAVAASAAAESQDSGSTAAIAGRGEKANLPYASEPHVQGDVAELTRMLKNAMLTEMRTTYNGSYGASVFFLASEVTWYVTLFQNKTFWRVLKTQDRARANAVYANFVQQTEQLSKVEIERIELAAQRAALDRMIAVAENSASRMRADIDIARQQQVQVSERQRTTYEQTRSLNVEKQAAQIQLGDLRKQLRQLQEQAEAGLPPAHR
jgi:hypothetical protein